MPIRATRPTADVPPTPSAAADPSPKVLALLSFAVSTLFLAHYYRYSQILLSGDAVGHINIARRVFDSRTPGLGQIGTVWLPLQHLLTIPFIVSTSMWSSGIGGSIPTMAGYIIGVLGMYRLVRDGLDSRLAGWIAALIYGANPNLLYVQTTALNEPLSMGLFIWAVVWFCDFAKRSLQPPLASHEQIANLHKEALIRHPLVLCGLALLGEILIRYDGWFNGCAFGVATLIVLYLAHRCGRDLRAFRRPFLTFVILLAVGPAFWFAWNAAFFGDPLAFMYGPYSAKAIEERTTPPGSPHHPGWHAPGVATLYLLRDLQLNLGAGRLLVGPPQRTAYAPTASPGRWQHLWLPIAALGTLIVILWARAALWSLLLWLPLPFYAISIAWGSVPIFIPVWWPFSYYNTRYALELLPAIPAFWAAAAWFVIRTLRQRLPAGRGRFTCVAVTLLTLLYVGFSYGSIWRTVPICLREIRANGGARYGMDGELAALLRRLPSNATILMYLGDNGGALERAPLPLKRTINEGNYELWEDALRHPAASADYIIAADGDQVADAVRAHPEGLAVVAVIDAPWQNPIRIYRPIATMPRP